MQKLTRVGFTCLPPEVPPAPFSSHSVHLFSDHHPLRSISPSPHSTSPNLSIQPLTDPLTNCYFPSLIIYISSSLGSIVLKQSKLSNELSQGPNCPSQAFCKQQSKYQMAPIQIFAVNLKEDWFIYHGGGIILIDSFIMIIIVE